MPPQHRAELEALGQNQCYALLRQADPSAAERIMANDAVRTQRALEVLYATGRPLSQQQGSNPPPWRVLELGLNPSNLKQRIAQRSHALYSDGLVAETQALQQRYGADCPLLDTIGYAEAAALLRGELNGQAIAQTTKRTQQFANANEPGFAASINRFGWIAAQDDDPLERALAAIEHVLG